MNNGTQLIQVLVDSFKPFCTVFIAWAKVFSCDFYGAFMENPLWFTVLLAIIGIIVGVLKNAIRFVILVFMVFIGLQILLYLMKEVQILPHGMLEIFV